MKRSPMPDRKSPMRRQGASAVRRPATKTTCDKAEDDRAFMARFRGLPCAVCGRTWFLRDENGDKIETVGHHMLPKSVYPEHRMEEKNIVPLCAEHHVPFAHERPSEFSEWLEANRPEIHEWVLSNRHHRNEG